MKFLEKDLERIIFDLYESNRDFLGERGLDFMGKCLRQKKIGNYGIADFIFVDHPYYHKHFGKHMKGLINIVELKKDNISVSSFFQAVGYLKGVQRYLSERGFLGNYNYQITIIGPCIDEKSTIAFLPDFFIHPEESEIGDFPKLNIELYTYDYRHDGIFFNSIEDYVLKNEGL